MRIKFYETFHHELETTYRMTITNKERFYLLQITTTPWVTQIQLFFSKNADKSQIYHYMPEQETKIANIINYSNFKLKTEQMSLDYKLNMIIFSHTVHRVNNMQHWGEALRKSILAILK